MYRRLICVLVGLVWLSAEGMADTGVLRREIRIALIEQYGSLQAAPLQTGILYDLVLPLSGLEMRDGAEPSPSTSRGQWLQAVSELRRADLDQSPLPLPAEFRERGRAAARDRVHPLVLLDYRYERIRPGLERDDVLTTDAQGRSRFNAAALETARVFAAALLHDYTYRGETVRFTLDAATRFLSNTGETPDALEADFDDGRGWRPLPQAGEIVVHYAQTGQKTVRVRANYSGGRRLFAKTHIEVLALTTPNPTAIWTLQARQSHNGQFHSGEAYLYLAPEHSVLTRPVIVSEGFDLDNSLNWDELYALLNQQELLETLRALGYDAVVLNYTDAVSYVQGNAYLVETLIDSVNAVIPPEAASVLVGASMGGLTTRYALAHMESQSRPHRIRTLISFDAPQRGANIPLGIQYWVDFFASESEDAAFLRDRLNSPAARQMLITHFTNPPASVPGSDPLFPALQNDFALLGGYPALPRKVAVANGSGSRQNTGFLPGAQLIRYEYRSLLIDVTGNVWALHNTQSQRIFEGEIDLIWPLPDRFQNVTVQPAWPWDNAPGGMRNTMQQMDSVAVPYGDLIALHNNHCFIPTISALDLATADPFFDIAGAPDLYGLSPFDSLYFPAENQEHVAVTPQNLEWFLQEVAGSLPAPDVVIIHDSTGVRLHWHPVSGANSYRVYATTDWTLWPSNFSVTADTTWLETAPLSGSAFYFVQAAFSPASAHAGNGRIEIPE